MLCLPHLLCLCATLRNYVGSYAGTNVNPLRDIRTDYNRSRMTRMFSTGYASMDIIKGLKLKETLSYDYTVQKDSRYLNPLSGAGPKSGSDAQTSRDLLNMVVVIYFTQLCPYICRQAPS